jgi:hypothetical protein
LADGIHVNAERVDWWRTLGFDDGLFQCSQRFVVFLELAAQFQDCSETMF